MSLEIEALMIGNWKSVAELEEHLTLTELELVVTEARKQEEQRSRWLAMVNGINLTDNGETPEETVERMKRKAEAINNEGMTEDEFEFADFGIDVETDDD